MPIVGATIAIATGAALAAKMDGGDTIGVASFGDGATEEGIFHESMNLAAALRLPVLFFCENNLFSSHLHIGIRQPGNALARYAEAHRIPWEIVYGNDLVILDAAVARAVEAMRTSRGPRFIEAVTYRWRGHVGPREDEDVGVRRQEDLPLWKGRCPIRRLGEALVRAGDCSPADLDAARDTAAGQARDAWAAAERDPWPAPEQMLSAVYADSVA